VIESIGYLFSIKACHKNCHILRETAPCSSLTPLCCPSDANASAVTISRAPAVILASNLHKLVGSAKWTQ